MQRVTIGTIHTVARVARVACVMLLLRAVPVTAQDLAVRYHSEESNRLVIHTLYGPLAITIEGASQYTTRFAQPDSLIIRFERLDVQQFCICGHVTVPTGNLLLQPTILRVDRTGRTSVRSSPVGDDRGGMVTDPVMQFGGMFYRFPASLLEARAEWDDSSTDSYAQARKGSRERTTVTRHGHYHVERDTMVDAIPAWVVGVRERVHVISHLSTVKNDVKGIETFDGEEVGMLIVAKDGLGRLYRTQHGTYEGVLNIDRPSERPFAASATLYIDATFQRIP